MESFDPNTPLNARELDYISGLLNYDKFISLGQSLSIATSSEELARQYMENANASREMLNTWHSNQDPAKGRRLMIQALEDSGLTSLAETVRLGDQHHATGNAVASNLNMGMASFDPNTPLDDMELKFISRKLGLWQFIRLGQSLYIHVGIPFEVLERQYKENVDAPSGMLFTWHSNQDPAKERSLMVKALNQSSLISLAETIRMGGCHTVPQGMSTDQHHATGNAVVSNLNMGALLDDELKSVSKQPGPQEWLKLSTSSETTVVKLAREYKEKADAPSEILITWPSNQDPAKEIRLMINSSGACLDFLAEKDQMPERRALQPSSAQHPSRRRKRTHTLTLAGHEPETNTLDARQPSSAPYPSRPKVRSVAIPLQQPDIAPMRITQQTSYEITEIKLRDISNKLGRDWRMVGTYLGFNNSQIEVMLEEYRDVKECIFQMLLQWQNTNGVKATKEKFKKALRRSQREDLADFIDEADDYVLAN